MTLNCIHIFIVHCRNPPTECLKRGWRYQLANLLQHGNTLRHGSLNVCPYTEGGVDLNTKVAYTVLKVCRYRYGVLALLNNGQKRTGTSTNLFSSIN